MKHVIDGFLAAGQPGVSEPGGMEDGQCAMRGVCGEKAPALGGGHLPCARRSPPRPLPANVSQRLATVCPSLAGLDRYCCSPQQLVALEEQIQAGVQFLRGCPACSGNFVRLFCELACSPRQGAFVNVTAAVPGSAGAGDAVASIDFYVARALGEALYASCANVQFAAVNQKAMDFIGGGAANYREWFAFLGTDKGRRDPHKARPKATCTARPDFGRMRASPPQ